MSPVTVRQGILKQSPDVATAIHPFTLVFSYGGAGNVLVCNSCIAVEAHMRRFFFCDNDIQQWKWTKTWMGLALLCLPFTYKAKKKKKADKTGLLRVINFIGLILDGWMADGNFNWTTAVLELRYLLTREEGKAFITEAINLVVTEGRSGPHRSNYIPPAICQTLISINLV